MLARIGDGLQRQRITGTWLGKGLELAEKDVKPWTLGLSAKRMLCASSVVYSVKRSSTISLGLCPDWEAWDPNQPVQNAREAMQQADDWLGVPQVHWQMGVVRGRMEG